MSRLTKLIRAVTPWSKGGGGTAPEMTDSTMRALVSMLGSEGAPRVDPMGANKGWAFAANRQLWGRAARVPLNLFSVRLGGIGNGRGRPGRASRNLHRHGTERLRGHTGEWVPVGSHPFLDLVANPNPDESGLVFHARQVLQLQQAGISYVLCLPEVIDLEQKVEGQLVPKGIRITRLAQLRLLEPGAVSSYPDPERQRVVGLFRYSPPRGKGEPKWYRAAPGTPEEREEWKREPYPFVYRLVHPDAAGYEPASPVTAAAVAHATQEKLGIFHWNQLRNGIHAGLIFLISGSAAGDRTRFEKTVLLMKAGIGKAGEPMILPKGEVEVDKNPLSNQEMGFADLDSRTRQQVLATAGASDGIVGMGNPNRGTLWALERLFATGAVDVLNALIADGYNAFLIPMFPGQSARSWFECEFESAQMVDDKDVADYWSKLVAGSIATPNEARAAIGFAPHRNGDKLKPFSAGPKPGAGNPGEDPIGQAEAAAEVAEETDEEREVDLDAVFGLDGGCGCAEGKA